MFSSVCQDFPVVTVACICFKCLAGLESWMWLLCSSYLVTILLMIHQCSSLYKCIIHDGSCRLDKCSCLLIEISFLLFYSPFYFPFIKWYFFFYKILDLFTSFSRNGIFINRTGLSSLNKLGLKMNESSVFIVD